MKVVGVPVKQRENVWPFTEREVPASKPLKSGWSVGRASEEAYKAGYSGRVGFRDWLKSKKLDDRSQGQINLLARSYEDGMAKEDQDSRGKRGSGGYSGGGGHAGSGSGQVSSGALEKEVASALVNYGAGSGEAREAAREAVKGGGSFDAVFKMALDMVRHKQNPESPERIAELKHELSQLRTIAPLFSEGAISPTQYNRMGGHQRETYHKNVLRRYQVEDELAEASKSDEQRSREQKATRQKKIESRLLQLRSHLQDMNSIYVKPRLAEGKKVKPTIQRDIDMTNSEIEGLEDELRGLNPHSNSNPLGHGHWESFDSEKAAKQYARLMEGQGKSVTRHGKDVRVDEDNPARIKATVISALLRREGMLPVPSDRDGIQVRNGFIGATVVSSIAGDSNREIKLSQQAESIVTSHGYSIHRMSSNIFAVTGKDNPARSGAQYRLAQAVLNGQSDTMPVSVARELVEKTPASLRSAWSKRNPEPAAADMYESFHGRPSEQIVTFEEDEHYHEYLSELGVCCGLLVEKEDGKCVALGLSGYVWQGKGKDAGFVEGSDTRSNPRNGYGRATQAMALNTATATREELKKAESVLFRAIMKVMPSSPLQREFKEKYLKVREALGTSPNPKKGPILSSWDQANDLVYSGVKGLDQQLGKVLGSNPKSPADMTAGELNKALDKIDAESSKLTRQFIDAGRGHERPSEYLRMDDPLAMKARALHEARQKLAIERDLRMGPGSHSRLPKGFGPRKWRGNPAGDPVGPNTTLLSSNEDGTQLYLVGGDQSLDLDDLDITGHMATKELITIGDVVKLYYETEKDFDKFEVIQYHHEVGEESGVLPILAYDRLNKRMLFVGGDYHIEKPMFETSPGIEN